MKLEVTNIPAMLRGCHELSSRLSKAAIKAPLGHVHPKSQ